MSSLSRVFASRAAPNEGAQEGGKGGDQVGGFHQCARRGDDDGDVTERTRERERDNIGCSLASVRPSCIYCKGACEDSQPRGEWHRVATDMLCDAMRAALL
eukprot:4161102-Pyramimonas_sp.AAC.1